MINVPNEFYFLLLNLRACISFKIKCLVAYIFNGHFFRKKNIIDYIKTNKRIKIHFGSTHEIPGFFNSQILGKNPINITKKTPFENNTVDTIFSTHVIEHLHKNEILFFLKECYRILKPGGVNIIMTPSISKIVKTLYIDNEIKNRDYLLERQKKWASNTELNSCSYINGVFRNYGHRFILDSSFIKKECEKIGYKNIDVCKNFENPDKNINLYLKEHKKDYGWDLETETFLLFK